MNERLSNRSVHGDGLSSTQLVTDDTGAQAARIVYGAWGEELSVNDSVPGGLDVRFVGGLGVRNDSTTGLIYMRHRWYDAQLGRFISRDPIGHNSGMNLYQYPVNPMSFVDPSGLQTGAAVLGGGGSDVIGAGIQTMKTWGGRVVTGLGSEIGAGSLGGVAGIAGVGGAVGGAVAKSYESNQVLEAELIKIQSQIAAMEAQEIRDAMKTIYYLKSIEDTATQTCNQDKCNRRRTACHLRVRRETKSTESTQYFASFLARRLEELSGSKAMQAHADRWLRKMLGWDSLNRRFKCEVAYQFCLRGLDLVARTATSDWPRV